MTVSGERPGSAADSVGQVGPALLQNAEIAARLEEVGRVLAEQNADPYRTEAYRRAARAVRGWPTAISEIAIDKGVAGLAELPGIGEHLARAIYQLATTGRLPMLERLRGESDPVALLASVPGIGDRTARRMQDELDIHTLEELEIAAHDGRLEQVGVGSKRITSIRDALGGRLGRIGRRQAIGDIALPPVAEILDVDREYRERAEQGDLPKIAPRRFNPNREAWLPVLHTRRGDRYYTALFSNTARAHELNRTRDWVVLYFDGHGGERQCTVITSQRGPLRGRRIVRGREEECLRHYSGAGASPAAGH
jgi:DNA polymerase (family 10)